MAYHRETYRREEEDRDRNTGGGWKSWFGLGDDKKDNDYHYQRTTTYRNDDRDRDTSYNRGTYGGNTGYQQTSTYVRDSDRDRGYTGGNTSYDRFGSDYNRGTTTGYNSDRVGGYGGTYGDNRGGYGYQTSNEYSRTPIDRGYTGNYDRDNRESTYVRNYNTERDTYNRPTDRDSYSSSRYVSDNRGGFGGSSSYGLGGGYGGSYDTNARNTGYGGYGADTTRYGGNTGDRDRYGGSYSYAQRSNY